MLTITTKTDSALETKINERKPKRPSRGQAGGLERRFLQRVQRVASADAQLDVHLVANVPGKHEAVMNQEVRVRPLAVENQDLLASREVAHSSAVAGLQLQVEACGDLEGKTRTRMTAAGTVSAL